MRKQNDWEEVVALGSEGGEIVILGRLFTNEWVFAGRSYSLSLDEAGDEVIEVGESHAIRSLEEALPRKWPLLFPLWVHDDFVVWFRERLEFAVAGLSSYHRERHNSERWHELLSDSTSREYARMQRRPNV